MTFRALALRRSESRNCGLCGCVWFISNSPIRYDEGLTLETPAFESLYGGQFTLSTQSLIKPNYVVFNVYANLEQKFDR